jgi:DeoR family myo-inositol catabolism operon transcriptional repressor
MIQYERQQAILNYLTNHSPASIKDIADRGYASQASVRRDVARMEEQGLVKRIYGGVLLNDAKNGVVPLALRDGENAGAKDRIAREAASLVFDGATVLLDASSTVHRMVKHLRGYKNLCIITNSLRICADAEGFDGRIYCTGGALDQKNRAFYGPAAERFLDTICADFVFFSSQGITEEGEISDASEQETSLRRSMLGRAKKKYFLFDSTKIGRQELFTVCNDRDLDGIFCDVEYRKHTKDD